MNNIAKPHKTSRNFTKEPMSSLRYFLPAAAICLAFAVAASAQGYRQYGYGHQQAYHQPYQPPHKVVIVETLVVPYAVPATAFINVAAPAYPPAVTISPSLFQQSQQQVLAKDDVLAKRLDRLDAKLNQLLTPTRAAAETTRGPPKLRFSPGAQPATQQRIELATVAAIFNQHCSSCHTGADSEKGVQIFNDQGQYEPTVSVNSLVTQALSGRMPKGPNKVGQDQKAVLSLYRDQQKTQK